MSLYGFVQLESPSPGNGSLFETPSELRIASGLILKPYNLQTERQLCINIA